MKSVLTEIYSGDLSGRFHPSKEYVKRRDERIAYMEQVQEVFGYDFMDKMATLDALMAVEEDENTFQRGFRLGALLMLELLYEPPQPVLK